MHDSRFGSWPLGFRGTSDGKESACNVGNMGSIPGSGRSPGEGNGYPLQYSCLENPMDRGATVHRSKRLGHDLATQQQRQAPSTFSVSVVTFG